MLTPSPLLQKAVFTLGLLAGLLCLTASAQAQKYLIIDRYNTQRIKLQAGDELHFKLKNHNTLYQDHIKALKDTSIILASTQQNLPLEEFQEIRFPNYGTRALSIGTHFIAGGFLLSAAVHPLMEEPQYDSRESLIIGVSFLAIGQALRLFKWKKFKMGKRGRVRIVDTTFRRASPTDDR